MKRFIKNERGISLIEMIIVMIIVGIALPSLFAMVGFIATHHAKNEILTRCMDLAVSRMEEIISYKNQNWDWYSSINNFEEEEVIDQHFTRQTTITSVNNWGAGGVDSYDVTVTVAHLHFSQGYTVNVRLTVFN